MHAPDMLAIEHGQFCLCSLARNFARPPENIAGGGLKSGQDISAMLSWSICPALAAAARSIKVLL